jgi:hypothetical protein
MSALLAGSSDCCDVCEEPVAVQIPGTQGDPAEPCTPCVDGTNAFTTADSFAMPAELANVTVTVLNSDWMTSGQIVWAKGGGAQGNFEVQSAPTSTSVILKNLEDTPNNLYTSNSPPATVFPALTSISPSGQQGPPGINPTGKAPDDATYITITANADLTSEVPLNGMGDGVLDFNDTTNVLGTTPKGVADGNIVKVDDAAGLTNQQAIFATASGIESVTDQIAIDRISPLTNQGDLLTHDGVNNVRRAVGASANMVPRADGAGDWAWALIGSILSGAVSQLLDQSVSGTAAQLLGYGAWTTLTLNSTNDAPGNIVSLAANQFVLEAGTYAVIGICQPEQCYIRFRLRNVTGAATLIQSIQLRTLNNSASILPLVGVFTVAAAQTLEWQYYATNDGGGAAAFGFPMTTGDDELYKSLTLLKIA